MYQSVGRSHKRGVVCWGKTSLLKTRQRNHRRAFQRHYGPRHRSLGCLRFCAPLKTDYACECRAASARPLPALFMYRTSRLVHAWPRHAGQSGVITYVVTQCYPTIGRALHLQTETGSTSTIWISSFSVSAKLKFISATCGATTESRTTKVIFMSASPENEVATSDPRFDMRLTEKFDDDDSLSNGWTWVAAIMIAGVLILSGYLDQESTSIQSSSSVVSTNYASSSSAQRTTLADANRPAHRSGKGH